MWKMIAFSVCSVLVAIVAICWIVGVIPSERASRRSSAFVSAKGASPTTSPATSDDNISVYFSPNGGCTEAIVHEIAGASQCIYVQAAQFTSGPIAKALVAAKERGVDVRVIIDSGKDNDEKSEADRLADGGVATFVDAQHHTAHNKIMLIDHRLIFTGSFNFTHESETENAENLLRIENKPKLLAAYEANFKEHLSHSTPYKK